MSSHDSGTNIVDLDLDPSPAAFHTSLRYHSGRLLPHTSITSPSHHGSRASWATTSTSKRHFVNHPTPSSILDSNHSLSRRYTAFPGLECLTSRPTPSSIYSALQQTHLRTFSTHIRSALTQASTHEKSNSPPFKARPILDSSRIFFTALRLGSRLAAPAFCFASRTPTTPAESTREGTFSLLLLPQKTCVEHLLPGGCRKLVTESPHPTPSPDLD